jgi:thioredoxin
MTLPSAPLTPPRRRFPRWLIAVLIAGGIGTLAFCAIISIGVLTLLGSKVTPAASNPAASNPSNTTALLYDPHADANQAIAQAIRQAKKNQKRVLLDFGADWCPDCQVLSQLFDNPKVKPFLDQHYIVVRIDVGKWDNNLDIAKHYGDPIAQGIPAVVILDANAQMITSTAGGELANARTATPTEILGFLEQWAGAKK